MGWSLDSSNKTFFSNSRESTKQNFLFNEVNYNENYNEV